MSASFEVTDEMIEAAAAELFAFDYHATPADFPLIESEQVRNTFRRKARIALAAAEEAS